MSIDRKKNPYSRNSTQILTKNVEFLILQYCHRGNYLNFRKTICIIIGMNTPLTNTEKRQARFLSGEISSGSYIWISFNFNIMCQYSLYYWCLKYIQLSDLPCLFYLYFFSLKHDSSSSEMSVYFPVLYSSDVLCRWLIALTTEYLIF